MKKNTLIICCILICVAVANLAVVDASFLNYYIVFCCYASIVAFAVRDYKKSKEHKS